MRTYKVIWEETGEVVADNLSTLSEVADYLGMTGFDSLGSYLMKHNEASVPPYVVTVEDWNPLAPWKV